MARCTSSVASRPSSRIVFGPRSTNSRIREDRGAADGDRRRRVVPCREDVAGSPADSAPSALSVSMSTAVSLDGHVQRAGNLRAAGWQRILADGHQHGYLTLGEGDLLETPSPAGAARRPLQCSLGNARILPQIVPRSIRSGGASCEDNAPWTGPAQRVGVAAIRGTRGFSDMGCWCPRPSSTGSRVERRPPVHRWPRPPGIFTTVVALLFV